MTSKIYVGCHAPSLSLLLFESVSTELCQIGLLIGSVQKLTVTTTTDASEAENEEKTVIYVENCVALPSNAFNDIGEANIEIMQSYCQTWCNKIVGWYSFRRNRLKLQTSLRDVLIHKSLVQSIESVQSTTFIVGILSASAHNGLATHSFRHVFMRLGSTSKFESIPLKVFSLSDSLANSSGYMKTFALPQSTQFKTVLQSAYQSRMTSTQDNTTSIKSILLNTATLLKNTGNELLKREDELKTLTKEVKALKKIIVPSPSVPVIIESAPPTQNRNSADHFVKFDPKCDYAAGRIIQSLDEIMDMDTAQPSYCSPVLEENFTPSKLPSRSGHSGDFESFFAIDHSNPIADSPTTSRNIWNSTDFQNHDSSKDSRSLPCMGRGRGKMFHTEKPMGYAGAVKGMVTVNDLEQSLFSSDVESHHSDSQLNKIKYASNSDKDMMNENMSIAPASKSSVNSQDNVNKPITGSASPSNVRPHISSSPTVEPPESHSSNPDTQISNSGRNSLGWSRGNRNADGADFGWNSPSTNSSQTNDDNDNLSYQNDSKSGTNVTMLRSRGRGRNKGKNHVQNFD